MIKTEVLGLDRLEMSWGYMPRIPETLRTEGKVSFNQFDHEKVCINQEISMDPNHTLIHIWSVLSSSVTGIK